MLTKLDNVKVHLISQPTIDFPHSNKESKNQFIPLPILDATDTYIYNPEATLIYITISNNILTFRLIRSDEQFHKFIQDINLSNNYINIKLDQLYTYLSENSDKLYGLLFNEEVQNEINKWETSILELSERINRINSLNTDPNSNSN